MTEEASKLIELFNVICGDLRTLCFMAVNQTPSQNPRPQDAAVALNGLHHVPQEAGLQEKEKLTGKVSEKGFKNFPSLNGLSRWDLNPDRLISSLRCSRHTYIYSESQGGVGALFCSKITKVECKKALNVPLPVRAISDLKAIMTPLSLYVLYWARSEGGSRPS